MARKKGAAGTILVVEDDPAVRMVVELAVESDGITVHGEGNGSRALQWLEKNRPAMLVLDLDLPGANGAELAVAARERYGDKLPILIMSGLPNCRQIANKLGASGCLAKPFDLDVLTTFVRGAVIDTPAEPVAKKPRAKAAAGRG
jgi:two-component system response regulator (stage 0 sporulation protein F)